ncbi:MAG: enoyl-CoA hydratase/isomerase family protein [Promethearchaeota archaeon]|nr:MAG: enoyl-CoA hydratase/isomerase family protein [Candidatus Lokiarchaeota archaeon]
MALYKNWTFSLEDGIFYLNINRPEKKNAFDSSVIEELSNILNNEILLNLSQIRVIIVSSSLDDYFTVGLDINWLITLDEEQAKEMTIQLQNLFNQIEILPVPVIMVVKGINLTAGFELMLCCDFVIAAENARFGQVETKWGMTPAAGATQRLIRFVGPLKAKEIIYTSKIFNAQEAVEMGLVNKIVPLNEIEVHVTEIAQLITQNSGKAIALCKKMIHSGLYNNPQGFQMESQSFHECFKTGEPKKKLQKFIDGIER